jgi:pimeloyl-ACP methyl ester carboxylesterase
MRRLLPFLLLVAIGPASGAPPDAGPEWTEAKTDALRALAREYAGKGDRYGKDEVLERTRKLGPIPDRPLKDVVKALFTVAREGPKSEGGGTCTAKFPRFPGTYQLSGSGGGRKGVFIGLHGGGPGVGEGGSAAGQWGGATGKGLIGVFPTANLSGRDTTWQSPDVEAFVIAILAELKRTFPIDTNRVYIAGHSLGGSGAYHIGLRHADLFAAVSPNAGGCHGVEVKPGVFEVPGGFVANLLHTGCFITHYDLDPRVGVGDSRAVARELDELAAQHPGGYDHVYIEGQGVNHGFPPKGDPSTIISWMTRHVRTPCPKKVVWEPANPEKRLFYWLRMASPFGGSRNGRIVATIEDNVIEVRGLSTMGLSVLLAEEMFDARRPLAVRLEGKEVFSGLLSRDPRALVESVMENIDPAQVFTYRFDLP